MVDVPAHVQTGPHIQNGVRVHGGTNWDLSRSAVPTPIQVVPDPPVIRHESPSVFVRGGRESASYPERTGLSGRNPVVTIGFAFDSATLSSASRAAVCKLPRATWKAAGHASLTESNPAVLSEKRAQAVQAALRDCGKGAVSASGYASRVPVSDDEPSANQRVEVFRMR